MSGYLVEETVIVVNLLEISLFCLKKVVLRQLGDLLFPVCISCHVCHNLFSIPSSFIQYLLRA